MSRRERNRMVKAADVREWWTSRSPEERAELNELAEAGRYRRIYQRYVKWFVRTCAHEFAADVREETDGRRVLDKEDDLALTLMVQRALPRQNEFNEAFDDMVESLALGEESPLPLSTANPARRRDRYVGKGGTENA